MHVLSFLKDRVVELVKDEGGQDGFEYLLVIGGVSVAVILAIATPAGGAMVGAVIDGTCSAIDTIPNFPTANCTP